MDDLWIVTRVALTTMMAVLIFGTYYDALFKDRVVRTVPCSVTIENMAANLNVTLTDLCEVEE